MNQSSGLSLFVGGTVVIPDVRPAVRFHERFVGLMGHAPLGPGRGLWLSPCRSIHTCFMRFAIDVLFLDSAGTVLRFARDVKPWRLAWAPSGSQSVVEMETGWLLSDAIRVGDRVEIG